MRVLSYSFGEWVMLKRSGPDGPTLNAIERVLNSYVVRSEKLPLIHFSVKHAMDQSLLVRDVLQ